MAAALRTGEYWDRPEGPVSTAVVAAALAALVAVGSAAAAADAVVHVASLDCPGVHVNKLQWSIGLQGHQSLHQQ